MGNYMFSKFKSFISSYVFLFSIVLLLILLFLTGYAYFRQMNSYKSALSELESEIELSYAAGYNDGYSSGKHAGSTTYYFKEIDSMSPDEILYYLESVTNTRYFDMEEVLSIFAYAFQRGYNAYQSGVVSDMEDEYLNGYLIHPDTALEYDFIFGLD